MSDRLPIGKCCHCGEPLNVFERQFEARTPGLVECGSCASRRRRRELILTLPKGPRRPPTVVRDDPDLPPAA